MLGLTLVPIQQETSASRRSFKFEGVQNEGFDASACENAVSAASHRGGKFRPPGMVSAFCISTQHLPQHLRTSPDAGVNVKQIQYNFSIKLSGYNQLTSSQQQTAFMSLH